MQKVATKGIREPQDEHEFNEQHFEACRNEVSWQVGREWRVESGGSSTRTCRIACCAIPWCLNGLQRFKLRSCLSLSLFPLVLSVQPQQWKLLQIGRTEVWAWPA